MAANPFNPYGLTASELAILRAIDAAPGKVLVWHDCHRASGLTLRGARSKINGLIDRSFIARSEMPATRDWPTLTFKGMQALKAEAA